MLVLSRQIGEAIVIDDQIVVMVERFTADDLELSLANVRGVPLGRLVVSRDEMAALPNDVQIVLIRAGADRVRLGLSCADDSGTGDRIERKEFWDKLRGVN